VEELFHIVEPSLGKQLLFSRGPQKMYRPALHPHGLGDEIGTSPAKRRVIGIEGGASSLAPASQSSRP